MRGADLLAETMERAGIRHVFSLSGNQIMPLYDALLDRDIRLVHTRHEAAAVFMADAAAQLTGTAGVALVTAAPGFANALGALYTAASSESPVVLLSGDSPVAADGTGAFQEFAQEEAARPFVKATRRVTRAADLADAFCEAMRLARSGRPGPVHLALPMDVLNADGGDARSVADGFEPEIRAPHPRQVETVREALAAAERPLVLTGPSLNPTRAPRLSERLSDAVGAPVVSLESPRGLRDPALGAVADVLARADMVLLLGRRIDYALRGGDALANARVAVIDAEADEIARAGTLLQSRLSLTVHADPRACAEAFVDAARAPRERDGWRGEAAAALRARMEHDHPCRPGSGIAPRAVAEAVGRLLETAAEPILICDGGEFGQWAQGFAHAPLRLINGPSGAIGGSLPYAIAAKIVRPGATVVAMMGDGTAGFHLAEFETAAREGADLVAVIGNDGRWNAERLIQVREFGKERVFGCDLSPDARYDAAASALGCHGERVTHAERLSAALAEAVRARLPACLDVEIVGEAAPEAPRQPEMEAAD